MAAETRGTLTPGPAVWIATSIWVLYRLIRGYLLFKDSKPVPEV